MRVVLDPNKPVRETGQASGVSLMLSWANLQGELQRAHVIRYGEVISSIVISVDGLYISVENA